MATVGIILSSIVAMVVTVGLAIFSDLTAFQLVLAYFLVGMIAFWSLILWFVMLPNSKTPVSQGPIHGPIRPACPESGISGRFAMPDTASRQVTAGSINAMVPHHGMPGSHWNGSGDSSATSGSQHRRGPVGQSTFGGGGHCFAPGVGQKPGKE